MWDAIVIGAGPAGAASAYLLAKRGWRVLLLERSAWPRDKPCGGCLSASAVACLDAMDLTSVIDDATPIRASVIHTPHNTARLPVNDVVAIPRDLLDAMLVRAFAAVGGTFVSRASASVLASDQALETRNVRAGVEGETIDLRGRIILACDGLSGSSLTNEPWATWAIAPDAYLGVAAGVRVGLFPLDSHEIHMHVGEGGYVGAVRYAEGDIHLAAAIDPQRARAAGGPAALVSSILGACGRPITPKDLKLKGVPTLTRRRTQLGGHRVLAVGDACGYVEPFTGEGVAWALRSAIEVVSLLDDEWKDAMPDRWAQAHRRSLGRKQALCHAVRQVVRRPLLARSAVELLRHVPAVSSWITRAHEVRP